MVGMKKFGIVMKILSLMKEFPVSLCDFLKSKLRPTSSTNALYRFRQEEH